MKVKVEMTVEVPDDRISGSGIAYDIVQALIDSKDGRDFYDCEVTKCLPALIDFKQLEGIGDVKLICLESFEAAHTNTIGGDRVTRFCKYEAGVQYWASSWRPEGMMISNENNSGIWVFNADANKFAVVGHCLMK